MTWENNTAGLDISMGTEKFGGPVIETATVAGTGVGSVGGQITFEPVHQNQRSGLVVSNGLVYVAWGRFPTSATITVGSWRSTPRLCSGSRP
jgi:hypothetical protein